MNPLFLAAALAGGILSSAAAAAPSPRLVTLGGPVTEIVFALGAGEDVVAVDISSTYPPETSGLQKVGYHRTLSAEGILSLRPDLVLGTEEAGPPAALQQLRAAKVPIRLLPVEHSPAGTRRNILAIAKILNRERSGRELVASLDRDLASARTLVQASRTAPRVLFLYARGQGTLSVSGSGTAADAMIALAGGVNAVDGYAGYKPLTPEALASAAPDAILLTTGGLESIGGREVLLAQPGISLTPAGKAGRVVTLDDELLLGFGPRLGTGIAELTRRLHPGLVSPTQSRGK